MTQASKKSRILTTSQKHQTYLLFLTSVFKIVKTSITRYALLDQFSPICLLTAVQHERGPRKPKLQQNSSSQMHPSVSSGLQHVASGDGKLSTSSGPLHFPSSLFGHHPHPLKALSLSGPPITSSTTHLDVKQPPMFHPHQAMPPPPGLLHILMSAEKYQVKTIPYIPISYQHEFNARNLENILKLSTKNYW